MKTRLRESGALLAGEMSGHVFLADAWYGFDDGIYAAIRLIAACAAGPLAHRTARAMPETIARPNCALRWTRRASLPRWRK
jgi:phosphomannomutase